VRCSRQFLSCKLRRTEGILTKPQQSQILVDVMFRFSPSAIPQLVSRFLATVACVVVLAALGGGVRAQEEVITTETALVQLNIGVVDKQGHSITNLSASDFAVYEDGVRRPILHFEPTDAPFSLVMMLDTSGSTVTFRQQIQGAALRFLDALRPEDRVAIVDFNGKGPKLQLSFSTDRHRIAYTIGVTLATGKGETPLYDALKYSMKQLEHEAPRRRKAIVVLTDGLDTEARNSDRAIVSKASDGEISSAIKAENNHQLVSVLSDADRQGVTIFPLALPSGDPKHLPLPDPAINAMYTAARDRLQILADRTGGRLHEIRRLDDLAKLYAEVAADLRTLYSLAYQPPNPSSHDGKWRQIRVEVSRGELVASTKPGYFAH
jgi:Ca-activated chloride channel homolog